MPTSPSRNTPIKVVLIDDHFLIHESVAHQLANQLDIVLVATGTAGEEIEPLIQQHRPQVVLLDIGIPPKVGASIRVAGRYPVLPAILRLRQDYPETQFVILSADMDASLVSGALEVGARGYLLKDDELSIHLPEALRAVQRGALYFSSDVAQLLTSQPPAKRDPARELTERQMEVLCAIVANANLSYAEHAQRMGISEDTFRNHIRAIFEKLDASNLTSAILRAIQQGVIPLALLGLRPSKEK